MARPGTIGGPAPKLPKKKKDVLIPGSPAAKKAMAQGKTDSSKAKYDKNGKRIFSGTGSTTSNKRMPDVKFSTDVRGTGVTPAPKKKLQGGKTSSPKPGTVVSADAAAKANEKMKRDERARKNAAPGKSMTAPSKSMIAPATPRRKATTTFDGRKVTLLPKKTTSSPRGKFGSR
jgi:hypothetical protein